MVARHLLRLRRSIVVLLFLMIVLAVPSRVGTLTAAVEPTQVIVRVWPTSALEPANLLVMVSVERNPENRAMRITADSADYFSSSEMSLDGDRAPRVRTVIFRGLPAGDYMLRGEVLGANRQLRGEAHARALVAAR
jgi:hypothetical protein